MFPTLHDLAPWLPPLGTHEFFVALGLAAAGIVFLIERRRRGVTDPRIPYLVLGALTGAAALPQALRTCVSTAAIASSSS